MPTYIESSNCRGMRPSGIIGLHHNLRSDITGTMLRDRSVPRFLVAPKGYGKSSCAYEYAQVVFGFEHVFWLKCDSPCFLRDLDEGTIASQILEIDRAAKMIVLDDVPSLDQARTEALNELIGEAIEGNIEIIVTCVPSADTFSMCHVEKILLDANALLATDDEVEIERMRGNISREAASRLVPSRRAACLIWSDKGAQQILKGLAMEELPGELELAVFCMLVLGEGHVDDLSAILPTTRLHEIATYVARMFPYLGMDVDAGAFDSIEAKVDDVLLHSKFSPAALGRASIQGDREKLAMHLADVLLAKGSGRRAADLLGALATRATQAKWLAAHGWELLVRGFPLAVELIASAGCSSDAGARESLNAMRSWALAMLEDGNGSVRAAERVMASSHADWRDIVAAALSQRIIDGNGNEESLRAGFAKATALREAMAEGDEAPCIDDAVDWAFLLDWERPSGDQRPVVASSEGMRNAALMAGAWFLEEHWRSNLSSIDAESKARFIETVAPVVAQLASELKGASPESTLSWPECVAVNALQSVFESHPYSFDESLSPKLISASRSSAVRILVQVEEYRKGLALKEEARGEYELTHEDTFRRKPQPASKVAVLRMGTPLLGLSLFGGIEAWVGEDRSDLRQVKRTNAKIVLAVLALNRGREITKDKLAAIIWPEIAPAAGRQNLYVVWSYLKKLLKVGPSCPYLISTQTGYKLDSRFVVADAQRFDELCKDLLFGRDDRDVWEELYEQVSGDFAEDLLPEVVGNAYIDSIRLRLRTQLVDGLVEASNRMERTGETRGAIWFAREALRRDSSREDAYIALMEAQIASNQRGAALDTYFECRRFLSEQLGIDPSRRVIELYRSVIETEEEF